MPGFFVGEVAALGAGGEEVNRAPFAADYEFCGEDVPQIFGDDVDCQEVELASPVDLAAGAWPGVADVESLGSLESLAGGGFDLDAHEVAAGFDDYVVAGGVSPGAEDPEALF